MANPLRTSPHTPRPSSDNPPYRSQPRPVPRVRGPPPPFATPQQEEVANRWTGPLEDPSTFTSPVKPPPAPLATTTPPFTASRSTTPPTATSPAAPTSTPTYQGRSSEPSPCTQAVNSRSDHQAPEVNITAHRKGHEFFDPEQKRRECREKDVSSKEAAARWAAAKQAEKENAEMEAAEAATRAGRVESEKVDEGGEVEVQGSEEAGGEVQEAEDTVREMGAVERVWGTVEFMRMMRDKFPEVRRRLEAGGQAGRHPEVDAPGTAGGGGGRARRGRAVRGREGNRA